MPLHPVTIHHQKHHRIDGWLPQIDYCDRCQEAWSNCQYKIVYRSRKEADKAAIKQNDAIRWWPDACKLAYHCFWCGKWHLTTAVREWQIPKVEKMYKKATKKSDKSARRRCGDEPEAA